MFSSDGFVFGSIRSQPYTITNCCNQDKYIGNIIQRLPTHTIPTIEKCSASEI